MCPATTAVAPAGSLPYHYGSPQRHWIYTGPLVIVSTALDAFYTAAPASPRCGASTEKARSLHRIYGYTQRGTHSILTIVSEPVASV